MNQTKKRLSIIKLAISITDIETIQLQVLKLSPIKTDSKIQEILSLLQEGNYAQAQGLITTYIETAPDEILQRTSQISQAGISEEDQAIIDEFDLFITPSSSPESEIRELDISEYTSREPKITKPKHEVDFDALLNLEADDILPDNINIDLSHKPSSSDQTDNFFAEHQESIAVKHDSFFDNEINEEEENSDQEALLSLDIEETSEDTPKETSETPHTDESKTASDKSIEYAAMPHITQKLINTKKRYPPIVKTYEKFITVETFLTKIAEKGYSESEIEETIQYIYKLIEDSKYTEASQLLLVCGATESKFAQFILAREVYKGSLLTKNIEESFSLMSALAEKEYPEALCDLGQFYEHAIGTEQDLKKAEELYQRSFELGIQRAKKHYNRLKKQNRSFFKN